LNHLTQAARAVLQNLGQIQQMIADWNRLDFDLIRDQAWICQCSDDIIQSAQEDFKRFLAERASLEQWAQWLQDVVHRILGKITDPRELVTLAQQFVLKWSFYSTLIIRDLTIRNATSFGSFHLLRTLFDEYIFHLVEQKIASISQLSPYSINPFTFDSGIPEAFTQHAANQSMDPFSLESLLNKDNGGPRLKHAFQDVEKSHMSEEDYARWDMLGQESLLHLNVGMPGFHGIPQYSVPRGYDMRMQHIERISSPTNFIRANSPALSLGKRTAYSQMSYPPTQTIAFDPYIHGLNMLDPSIRSQYGNSPSFESLAGPLSYGRDDSSNKRLRTEVIRDQETK